MVHGMFNQGLCQSKMGSDTSGYSGTPAGCPGGQGGVGDVTFPTSYVLKKKKKKKIFVAFVIKR